MPSASAKVEKVAEFMDSYRQTIKIVEHKIRNLEKRKAKLDSYKQEQEQGKELNADQLAAVAKYNEVMQQLDFSRDLVKQLGQVGEETNRAYKKQQKKEQTERGLMETDRYRQLLVFQRVLDKLLNNQRIRQDFLHGIHGTIKLTQEDVTALDEFASLICPEKDHPDYLQRVEIASEHISCLFQGKAKPVAGKNYKEIHALLLSISACEYFDPQKQQQQQQTVVDEPEPSLTTSEPPTPPPVASVPVNVVDSVPAQTIHTQESTYNFMQESQIDIESPHMDPAVVAVSSFVPPLQQMNNSQNVFSSSVDNINVALTDMSLNRLNTKNDEEQIEEWESSATIPNNTSTTYNNTNNAPIDANGRGDGSNMFDKAVRGYRGGNRGRRGSTNGFGGGRDYRGGGRGNRGGYQNGRGGGYREPRNDRNEADIDSNVFEANRNTRKRRGVPYPPYSDVTSQNNVAYNTGANNQYNAGAPSSGQQQPRGGRVQMAPNRLNVSSYPKN